LEYLHSRGIVYRDLKPENILISQHGHIVLTDFGLSKTGLVNKDARTNTRCGTPYYVAPEIILGEDYTKSVDFWSLGVVLYEMLFGVPPFYSEEAVGIYKKIVTNDYTIDSDQISENCENFIRSLLADDPHKRLTEVDEIKKHAFFTGYDWEKLKRQEVTPPYVPKVFGPDDTQFFDSDVLSTPIECDDTEVSEYSDWTVDIADIVPDNPPKSYARSHAHISPTPVIPINSINQAVSLEIVSPTQFSTSTSERNAPSDSISFSE